MEILVLIGSLELFPIAEWIGLFDPKFNNEESLLLKQPRLWNLYLRISKVFQLCKINASSPSDDVLFLFLFYCVFKGISMLGTVAAP